VALGAGVSSHEKHAIDEAPAGIDRKAAWLRGSSPSKNRQICAIRRPLASGRRWSAAGNRGASSIAYSDETRPVPAARWPAGKESRPERPTSRFSEVGEGSGWPGAEKRSHGRPALP